MDTKKRDEDVIATRPPVAERVGGAIRTAVDAENKVRRVVGDAAGAAARTVGNGIAGAGNAALGAVLGAGRDVARGFSAPDPVATPVARTPPAVPAGVRSGVGDIAPAIARGPLGARPMPAPSLTDAPAPNTFVGSRTGARSVNPDGSVSAAGSAPAIAGIPPTLGAAAASPMAAPIAPVRTPVAQRPNPVAAQATAVAGQAANTAAGIPQAALDPRSWQSEILRRANNATIGSSGTSKSRAREQEALLGLLSGAQAGANEQATETRRAATDLNSTDIGEAGATARNVVGENGANARTSATLASSEREGAAVRAVRPTVTLGDGAVALVGQDGTAQTVTGQDGKPITAAQPRNSGAITPQDVFKSYSAQREAITNNALLEPAQRAEMLAQLNADPLYAGLVGGPQAAPAQNIEVDANGNRAIKNPDGSYTPL